MEYSEKSPVGFMRYWMDYSYGFFRPVYNVGRSASCGYEYNICVVNRIYNECQRPEFGVREYKSIASKACPVFDGLLFHRFGGDQSALPDKASRTTALCSTCDNVGLESSRSLIEKLNCIDGNLRTISANKLFYDDVTTKWANETKAPHPRTLVLATLKGGLQKLSASKEWDSLTGSDKKNILRLQAVNSYSARVLMPLLSQPQISEVRAQFLDDLEMLTDYEFLAIFKTSPDNNYVLDGSSLFHLQNRLTRVEVKKAARFRVAELVARTMYSETQQATKTLGLLYQLRADLRVSQGESETRAIGALKGSPEAGRILSVLEKFQGSTRERNELLQNTIGGFIETYQNAASRSAERLKAFVSTLEAQGTSDYRLLGAYVALTAMDGAGFNNSIRAALDGIDRSESPLELKYAVADLVTSSVKMVSILNYTQRTIEKLQATAQDTGLEVVRTLSEISQRNPDTPIPFTTLLREVEGLVKPQLGAGLSALSRVESVFKDVLRSFITGLDETASVARQARGLSDIQRNRFGT